VEIELKFALILSIAITFSTFCFDVYVAYNIFKVTKLVFQKECTQLKSKQ